MLRHFSRKHFGLILLTMFLAVALVCTLALKNGHIIEKNGFTRRLTGHNAILITASQKPKTMITIAGATDSVIFFGTTDLSVVFSSNYLLRDWKFQEVTLPKNDTFKHNTYIYVQYPNVYAVAGNIPAVFTTSLTSNKYTRSTLHLPLFTRCLPLSAQTFVLRAFQTGKNPPDKVFYKADFTKKTMLQENHISEYRGDGGISTDGQLQWDAQSHSVVYSYFYKNRFLCMDTNLNLKYIGRTIDTLSSYQVQAGQVGTSKATSYTNISPSRFINWDECIQSGFLYVNSKIRADNENAQAIGDNSVIDMYNLLDGQYGGSFYIPFYKGEQVYSFKIKGKFLIALYKDYLAVFNVSFLQQ
jgi:hypothetical protein